MNRRSLIQSLCCAVAISAMDVFGMKAIECVVPTSPKQNIYTANVIQAMFKAGEEVEEPWQASDPSLKLVWSKIESYPDGFTLHSRIYVPTGTKPLTDEMVYGNGFTYNFAIREGESPAVEWIDIKP